LPEIEPGNNGTSTTETDKDLEVPVPQEFDGVTCTIPDVGPTITETELVPCPEAIDQSAGNNQLKETPDISETLKVRVLPKQQIVLPDIRLGCDGIANTKTFCEIAVPFPQTFEGVTNITPEFIPDITDIKFVPCPAVITHPDGNTQV
jgi:hypothetical protein